MSKIFLKIISVFALLISFTISSNGQNSFDLEIKNLTFQDSANFNEDVVTSMFIKNNSGQQFSGNLQVQYMFTQQLPNGNSNLIPSKVLNLSNLSIPTGDSILINDLFNTNPNRFGGGNNIVIVWPKYRNQVFNDLNPANDTKSKNIFIKTNGNGNNTIPNVLAAAKDEKKKVNTLNIYPNPFTDNISIENLKIGSSITIMNTIGEEIISTVAKRNSITFDVSNLNKGIYFIKIENESESTIYQKIIKR